MFLALFSTDPFVTIDLVFKFRLKYPKETKRQLAYTRQIFNVAFQLNYFEILQHFFTAKQQLTRQTQNMLKKKKNNFY